MAWKIFRNKTLKALDKIYKTYDQLYASYREFADSDNELLQAQAKIIRGQLYQTGAAFDIIIQEAGPSMLDTCEIQYGYIPYTALTKIVSKPKRKSGYVVDGKAKEYPNTATLRRLQTSITRSSLKCSKLAKLLNKRYKKAILENVQKNHSDMVTEGMELKLFKPEDFITEFNDSLICKLLELYYFPKEKANNEDELYYAHWYDLKGNIKENMFFSDSEIPLELEPITTAPMDVKAITSAPMDSI